MITKISAGRVEAPASPKSPAQISAWRKEARARLIADRLSLDPVDRRQHAGKTALHLSRLSEPLSKPTISFYWPFRAEPDLRPLMQTFVEGGGPCALPVIVEKKAPLVFRLWKPGDRLVPGVWNIPIPADGAEASPDVVIAPVVGFDCAGHRLRYGGGFFDRTLASLPHRPLAIGIGYDAAAVSTIFSLPYDVPREAIVAEREILKPTSGH
jgi:5-formyltetrahydrofolate cyclo-ligase